MRKSLNALQAGILLLGCMANTLAAQTPAHCLTQGQLQEIQERNVDDTRMFLSHIGWYFQGQTSDHGWVHNAEVLSYHQSVWTNSAGPGGRLEVFHYPGKPHVVVYHTDETCSDKIQGQIGTQTGTEPQPGGQTLRLGGQTLRLGGLHWRFAPDVYTGYTRQIEVLNKAALNQDAAAIQEREAAERAAAAAEEKAYRDKVREGDRAKASGYYTKAIVHYREAIALRDDGTLWEPIRYCERMNCLYREVRADSAYRAGNYTLALDLYREAIGCSAGKENIQTKMRLMERMIREQQLAAKKKEADRWYEEKRYAAALKVYNEMLQIDPGNSHARQRAQEMRLMLDFLQRRSTTVFRYGKMQQRAWSDWKTGLLNQLESRSSQSESGSCEARLYVRFDTSGRSIGNTQVTRCTDQTLRTYLDAYSRSATLLPAKDNGYFVGAEDELRLRMDWKTSPCMISINGNRDFSVVPPSAHSRLMSDFLRNRKAGPGNYQFRAKEKTLNGLAYTDISLHAFDNRKTAEGMWRTLLLPGAGARWLSYGTKGKRSSKRFLFLSGVAVGSLLYANAAYNQAQQSNNPVDAANLEEEARIAEGLAWFTGSISCCIYGGEILRTLKLGQQNKRYNQSWNESLKIEPLIIQSQRLAWP
jgi:tetratricopeptide (TPR) repeat protein